MQIQFKKRAHRSLTRRSFVTDICFNLNKSVYCQPCLRKGTPKNFRTFTELSGNTFFAASDIYFKMDVWAKTRIASDIRNSVDLQEMDK